MSAGDIVTVQTLLKTIHLLCITVSVGRSRSVKNAADTKLHFVNSLNWHHQSRDALISSAPCRGVSASGRSIRIN